MGKRYSLGITALNQQGWRIHTPVVFKIKNKRYRCKESVKHIVGNGIE